MITKIFPAAKKKGLPLFPSQMPEIPLIQDKKDLYEIIKENILKANTTKEQSIPKTLICKEKAVRKLNDRWKLLAADFPVLVEERGAKGEGGFMLKKDPENKESYRLADCSEGWPCLSSAGVEEREQHPFQPCPMGLLTIDNLLYALWRFGHFLS